MYNLCITLTKENTEEKKKASKPKINMCTCIVYVFFASK